MHLVSLSVTNFRNLSGVEINPSPGVNILHGNNGAGKTNLLEAIFVLCLSRSQRGATDSVMVKQGAEVYRIEGQIQQRGVMREVAVAYQRGGRKRITLDQVPVRARDLYENYCAVALGPEDTEILSGSPAVRRNFLDIYLSQFSSRYLACLVDYHKVLMHKNACLRLDGDPTPFNVLLVDHGAKIITARCEFIQELDRLAKECYAEISNGGSLRLTYQPSIPLEAGQTETDEIGQSFKVALAKHGERERSAQTSLVGPHRDEVLFQIGEYLARTHGSQGEWRTAAIAIKLAIYRLLRDKRQMRPVLLLDEVFAELDEQRSAALTKSFADFGQLFMTTATEPPECLRQQGRKFSVREGTVQEVG